MKKLLIPFIGFVLIVSFAMADQGVYGIVYKGLSSTPAAGATVVLNCSGTAWADTVTANNHGYYRIATPYPGSDFYIRAWKWYEETLWESDWENVIIPFDQWVEKDIYIFP